MPTFDPGSKPRGLRRVWMALRYSLQGLGAAFRHETAFRQESMLAAALLPVSVWLARDVAQWLMLVGSLMLVLIVELLNSALELAIDRDSLALDGLAKRAKDYGSAAVFLAMLGCGLVWGLALWQRWAGAGGG